MAIRSSVGKDPTGKLIVESDIAANQIVNDHLNQFGPTQAYVFEYNFAVQGGGQAALTLYDADPVNAGAALKIPDNFLILTAYVEGITTTTSGGSATIKLGVTGNDDLFVAATAMDNALYAAGGVTALTKEIPAKVDNANGVSVLATVATADLLAGKFRVHVLGREGA